MSNGKHYYSDYEVAEKIASHLSYEDALKFLVMDIHRMAAYIKIKELIREYRALEKAVENTKSWIETYEDFDDIDKQVARIVIGKITEHVEVEYETPPVNPQPKTGHWIKVTNGRGGHECDLYHEYAPSYQSGDEYLSKYCPKCGARMESEA